MEKKSVMDSYREIENLLYLYAERIDAGDLEGVAEMFADAEILALDQEGGVRGYEEVLSMYQSSTRIYDQTGTPCTKHVTTNVIIEVDEENNSATARSYFTVFQALEDFPLQTIIAGRYHDRFRRVGGKWRFKERKMIPELFGDLSRHLLFDAQEIKEKTESNFITQEKRKHPRARTVNLVSYICIDDEGYPLDQGMGNTLDISQGGLLMETKYPVDAKYVLLMSLDINEELISIKGEVVHCHEKEPQIFHTGVRFKEPNKRMREIVSKMIEAFYIKKIK